VFVKLDFRSLDRTLLGDESIDSLPDGVRGRLGRSVNWDAAFFRLKRSDNVKIAISDVTGVPLDRLAHLCLLVSLSCL
jgi:hypothetical protein